MPRNKCCRDLVIPLDGSPGPARPPVLDRDVGIFLHNDGSPRLWSSDAGSPERWVTYDLPPLFPGTPSSLAQLSRNTEGEVFYHSFLFRAWPLSVSAEAVTFCADHQLACWLASVVRELLGDFPGFLFVRPGRSTDRLCRVCVVPQRHSRTRWLLRFGSGLAALRAFTVTGTCTDMTFIARLMTTLQNAGEVVVPQAEDGMLRVAVPPVASFLVPLSVVQQPVAAVAHSDESDFALSADEGDDGLDGWDGAGHWFDSD